MLRASHHRRRLVTRLVLLLAILVFAVSLIDFVYSAAQRGRTYTVYTDPFTKASMKVSEDPLFEREYLDPEMQMQLDAAIALLALATILGVLLKRSKLSHRRKRLLFGTGAVVLTPAVVSLLFLTFRQLIELSN